MIGKTNKVALLALGICGAAGARAAIIFSNIELLADDPALISSSSVVKGDKFIDFNLPNAKVGDAYAPLRDGTIIIKYEAMTDNPNAPITLDQLNLFGLGSIAGTGKIMFQEIVEDMENPANGTLAKVDVLITDQSQLPFHSDLKFKNQSRHIRVKKLLELSAIDNPNFLGDKASLPLVEQTLVCVPEPGSIIALAAGALALVGRRRSK